MTRWSHACLPLLLFSVVGCGYQEAREAEARARQQAIKAQQQKIESQRQSQIAFEQAEKARADAEAARKAAEEPEKLATTRGIAVGQSIPVTGMNVLFVTKKTENTGLIQREFRTCLAGKHRADTAVTIFADKPTSQVLALTSKIDELLPDHPSLHAWVLLVGTSRKDEALKEQLRTAWTERKLKGVELAITEGREQYGLSKDADITVVFARKNKVVFHRAIQSNQFTDDTMTDVMAEIKKLAAK